MRATKTSSAQLLWRTKLPMLGYGEGGSATYLVVGAVCLSPLALCVSGTASVPVDLVQPVIRGTRRGGYTTRTVQQF